MKEIRTLRLMTRAVLLRVTTRTAAPLMRVLSTGQYFYKSEAV